MNVGKLLTALLQWLVWIVTAIIINIAFPVLWDAAAVAALELPWATCPGGAVDRVLVGLITAVIFTIALPRLRNAALICTLPLMAFTLMGSWEEGRRIRRWKKTRVSWVQKGYTYLRNQLNHLPQSTASSSEPSGQSWWLLQRKCELVQFPSLHWNWPRLQWRIGQVEGSSEPSLQSLWPSHFHQIGMQLLTQSETNPCWPEIDKKKKYQN